LGINLYDKSKIAVIPETIDPVELNSLILDIQANKISTDSLSSYLKARMSREAFNNKYKKACKLATGWMGIESEYADSRAFQLPLNPAVKIPCLNQSQLMLLNLSSEPSLEYPDFKIIDIKDYGSDTKAVIYSVSNLKILWIRWDLLNLDNCDFVNWSIQREGDPPIAGTFLDTRGRRLIFCIAIDDLSKYGVYEIEFQCYNDAASSKFTRVKFERTKRGAVLWEKPIS
jgi:hypothetical protein